MSKQVLIDKVKGQFASRAAAETAVDAVIGGMNEMIRSGETLQLRGFGTFTTKRYAEKMGRNVRTGEPIKIAARDTIKFKASKAEA